MKKKYKKPELLIENFILSDYVASCGVIVTFSQSGNCGKPSGVDPNFWDMGLFSGGNGCSMNIENADGGTVGVCYHNSAESMMVFTS